MFVDKVKVKLKAGDGGNGMISFRREKYVDKGGPYGGDGGNGASIVFKATRHLSTLLDYRYQKVLKANDGENGMNKKQHGKNAIDKVVQVPVGTLIIDPKTRAIIADLNYDEKEVVIARGGRGGRGNCRFVTARVTAPNFAENGEPGQTLEVLLELKLLADVGLVGFPSVGKSTLLSVISKARPEIAAYHFTTITPNLGVASTPSGQSFVVADLPGLIEGASQGKGLGLQFLRHIERCRVLIHVIDISGSEGRDPIDDYDKIMNELGQYEYDLLKRPMIIAANKADLEENLDNLRRLREHVPENIEIFEISALTHQGVDALLYATGQLVSETPMNQFETNELKGAIYKFEDADKFEVINEGNGRWRIEGESVERLFRMTNFTTHEGIMRFASTLKHMGVNDRLRELNCVQGDVVMIEGYEFEFME